MVLKLRTHPGFFYNYFYKLSTAMVQILNTDTLHDSIGILYYNFILEENIENSTLYKY